MTRRLLCAALAAASAAAVVGVSAPPATAAPARTSSYALPGSDVYPEGVTAVGRTFYVTSTTDGTIFRGTVDRPRAQVFLPGGADGRSTAIGLEASRDGRLVVAGGPTGKVFVYDTATRALVRAVDDGPASGPTFLNDVAIDRSGTAYVTDSLRPVLYRLRGAGRGTPGVLEPFVDLRGTAFAYGPGFNANGIVVSPDGRYAVVVASNTGALYRIDLRTRSVLRIDLGGATVVNGDGIELDGHRLFVVRNSDEVITTVRLSGRFTRGRVLAERHLPALQFPTTVASTRGRLLVVNSQFDQRAPGGRPVEPFTVASIPKA